VSELLVLFIDFTALLLILYNLKYHLSNICKGFSSRGKMIDGSIYPGYQLLRRYIQITYSLRIYLHASCLNQNMSLPVTSPKVK